MKYIENTSQEDPPKSFNFISLRESLLAKISEYKIPLEDAETLSLLNISGIINTHEIEQNELAMRTAKINIETITKQGFQSFLPSSNNDIQNLEVANDQYSSNELYFLAKANEYGIPYNKAEINFYELEDVICDYEELLDLAAENYIEFTPDPFDMTYSRIQLNQLIEEVEEKERAAKDDLRSDYLSCLGL